MIAFAFIDAQGIPTGGGMNREVPAGAIALPRPYTALDLPRLQFRDGAWTERAAPAPTPPTADEVAAQAAAHLHRARRDGVAQINAAAGRARGQILTDAPGQAEVYAAKRAEAVAFIADPAPVLTDYPFLRAEAGVSAGSPWQLAQLWLHLSDRAHAGLAHIEAARRTALAAIATAPDFAAIETIHHDFHQALTGLPV